MRSSLTVVALTSALMFAGCGGGGSSTPPAISAGGSQTSSNGSLSEQAISATNSMGTPMTALSNDNSTTSSLESVSRTAQSVILGSCQAYGGGGGYEFFAPDRAGDSNSTEQDYYYDVGCTQLARDVTRVWTSTGASSETVARTVTIYAAGSSTASATRTATDVLANATFDRYGFPVPTNGFARSETGSLQYSGSHTIDSDEAFVIAPLSGGSETFCSDSAGYNATGIAALSETFGWQGGVSSGGTRTVNADGSVTWTATHAGSASKGPIGSLSIATAAANTACPIGTPMFALVGGTVSDAYSIPTTATYKSGLLIGLTVANAQLANGNTLNITTNASVSPTSNLFITGTIANASTSIATFTVDAFGDGTLTLATGGSQYVITDWHVVK